jgi:tRNA (cytidine/uridine-2'-O-)-methyltransferase
MARLPASARHPAPVDAVFRHPTLKKSNGGLTTGPAARYSAEVNYEPLLHIVLYQPEIPHNTGAIGRTCVATACKLWLVRPLGFSLDDYYLRRAGLDYWPHLDWEVVDDWPTLVGRLPDRAPYLFSKSGTRSYFDVAYEPGDVLVFGNESSGLPPSLMAEHRERLLRVPMRPQVRSLNLSNAMAVAAFEALRQWRPTSPA